MGGFSLLMIIDSKGVDAFVTGMRERSRDFSLVTGPVSELMPAVLQRNIDAVTSPSLSPKYAARKAKTHAGKGLLRASDDLYNSFMPEHDSMSASAGTNVPYARALDQGFADRNLPARGYGYLTEEFIDHATGELLGHVMGQPVGGVD